MRRGASLREWVPRVVLRVAVVTVLLVAVAAALAASAFAHAAFVDSTPGAGVRLERSPPVIKLEFSEALNRALSRAKLVNSKTGDHVALSAVRSNDRTLAFRPGKALATAPYRVDWVSVSTDDEHPQRGSFGFGVRTAAGSGAHQVEQSPLARLGWLRIGVRAIFYIALFFFTGGLITSVLLGRREDPAGWLVPEAARSRLQRAGRDPKLVADRLWRRTLDAGWVAAGAAAAVAVADAVDASGGLSIQGLNDFLLTNSTGVARLATIVALGLAVVVASRRRLAAVALLIVAFWTVARSGHANSVEPRYLALFSDWIHLMAGAVWAGGLANVALAAVPVKDLRLMGPVLERFGRIALPAFLVAICAGFVNALVELGRPQELWETAYGRTLAVKIALVGLVAAASYWHALRLRPRLLRANPHPPERLERRHWRLLRIEPWIVGCVLAVAALLVAFPLPPRQSRAATAVGQAQARQSPGLACDPCPLAKPGTYELPVAEQAGSSIAAVWLRRQRGVLSGRLRLIDTDAKPVDADAKVWLASQQSCGKGCWDFNFQTDPPEIEVRVPEKGRTYVARLPTRWHLGGNARARQILRRAQRTMQRLRSVRQDETITSGPGSFAATRYRLNAPDRFAYRTNSGATSVVIGKWEWSGGDGAPTTKDRYGGSGPGFRTRSWFRWTAYASAVRLLGVHREHGRRVAELELMNAGTPPIWFHLTVDLATMRVPRVRMVTGGHFMNQRYFAFNRPVSIEAPRHSRGP